ncbi:MAG: cobalamin-dependent protein [Proteobacteria bacterium]|nr:cobalamin-dependent protein [Pseudomonadota bacterium]
MERKKRIYLADLTHKGLVLSSNVFPLSIGLIGGYLLEQRPGQADVQLFKYPEDFSAALEKQVPDIVGFANYSWNFHLEYQYAKLIKKLWPKTVVVFGGPNYGLEAEEVAEFWKHYPEIDFNIVREGERAFVDLFDSLTEAGFDAEALRRSLRPLPNCHYQVDGELVCGPDLPRLDLETLPSPYLMGLMDKFFDENLIPMIHTTRGCPFKCAFCTEGAAYYNIVEQRMNSFEEELHYIASRVRGPRDLFISDANFGMFKPDIEKARILADCQKRYNFPKYIHVSTGKNQKERVIEIAQMLDGALNMAASLQSTDPTVLANVERSNISLEKLSDVGLKANKVDTGTYSELILGLPGDSLAAHRQSLRDTVEANFDNIRMYQLIMLPQTKLNTPDMRRRFAMASKHRIMPRSFGRYSLAGHDFIAIESEEILIEHSTLSFADYTACREMDLTVEILHNGKVYAEVQGLCRSLALSWFDFIMRFYDKRRLYTPGITAMYDEFSKGMSARLWDDRQSLERAVVENFDEVQNNERGTNEMSMGKATAFFDLFREINDILFAEMKSWLAKLGRLDAMTEQYIDELCRFSCMRKADLTNYEAVLRDAFHFDMKAQERADFSASAGETRLGSEQTFVVAHTPSQRETLSAYTKEFGSSHDGLGKMLMRYPHVHRMFRRAEAA